MVVKLGREGSGGGEEGDTDIVRRILQAGWMGSLKGGGSTTGSHSIS